MKKKDTFNGSSRDNRDKGGFSGMAEVTNFMDDMMDAARPKMALGRVIHELDTAQQVALLRLMVEGTDPAYARKSLESLKLFYQEEMPSKRDVEAFKDMLTRVAAEPPAADVLSSFMAQRPKAPGPKK